LARSRRPMTVETPRPSAAQLLLQKATPPLSSIGLPASLQAPWPTAGQVGLNSSPVQQRLQARFSIYSLSDSSAVSKATQALGRHPPRENSRVRDVRTKHIAAPADPEEIMPGRVLLMTVNVSDFDGARGATKGADSGARRGAGVRPLAEGAVSYLARFLAPVSPALPGRYSPSSSSSESSE
jgi:hypothetical protein